MVMIFKLNLNFLKITNKINTSVNYIKRIKINDKNEIKIQIIIRINMRKIGSYKIINCNIIKIINLIKYIKKYMLH